MEEEATDKKNNKRISFFVSGLYFPQSNLTLNLPYSSGQNEVKLIGLRTLRNDSATPQNVKYQIRIPREEPSVNLTNTNDVILRNLPKNGWNIFIYVLFSKKILPNTVERQYVILAESFLFLLFL